ncbi:MAG: tRNA pseudouridine(13) synthase TruD [Candidatus Bathyarchaeia archaeon]
MKVPRIEAELGIEVYASKGKGIGGCIRCSPEDFIVEEILTDGFKASIDVKNEKSLFSGHGRYLICALVKRRWDTLVVVQKIAKSIGLSPERISIAGIKDAEALTAQHISLAGVSPETILKVNLKDVNIKPLRFSDKEISSKNLLGNHFTIIVRSIKYDPLTVQKRIEKNRGELMDFGGVPNFFGHQRFGTVRPITHQVGKYIVKGDFEKAALLFLSQPSSYEHLDAKNAREFLRDTQDFKGALKRFPRSFVYERLMLGHLSKYPKDFQGAFHRLPINLCRLFVQAYQSFLFNKFLSERIRRGIPLNKAQIGDYVVELDGIGLPTTIFNKTEEHNVASINEKISRGKMTVAIPLIGFKQSSSNGVQGEIEKGILEKESISSNDFRISKMPQANSPGGLRKVVTPILNLEIKEIATSNDFAVKFGFTLHKGSYATILLREFMKPKDLVREGF